MVEGGCNLFLNHLDWDSSVCEKKYRVRHPPPPSLGLSCLPGEGPLEAGLSTALEEEGRVGVLTIPPRELGGSRAGWG